MNYDSVVENLISNVYPLEKYSELKHKNFLNIYESLAFRSEEERNIILAQVKEKDPLAYSRIVGAYDIVNSDEELKKTYLSEIDRKKSQRGFGFASIQEPYIGNGESIKERRPFSPLNLDGLSREEKLQKLQQEEALLMEDLKQLEEDHKQLKELEKIIADLKVKVAEEKKQKAESVKEPMTDEKPAEEKSVDKISQFGDKE